MEDSAKLSWTSVMTPRFIADFVGKISANPILMQMLCYMEGLATVLKGLSSKCIILYPNRDVRKTGGNAC